MLQRSLSPCSRRKHVAPRAAAVAAAAAAAAGAAAVAGLQHAPPPSPLSPTTPTHLPAKDPWMSQLLLDHWAAAGAAAVPPAAGASSAASSHGAGRHAPVHGCLSDAHDSRAS